MVTRRAGWRPILLGSALLAAIAYDGYRLAGELRFNRELAAGAGVAASDAADGPAEPRRLFAHAYALQQRQDFKGAVRAYASIDAAPDSQLMLDVKFNLANLFFREAAQLRESGDEDLAMPLLELAKQNYREILRVESDHWDAKYNLELALMLAPETDPADTLAELNPERSVRALTIILSRDSLP